MMRKKLKKSNGERGRYQGVFVRRGEKRGFGAHKPTPTILLENITDENGTIVTDHLWFNLTKGFMDAKLQVGDTVAFDARAKQYQKGWRGHGDRAIFNPPTTDYKLSHPTKIEVITRKSQSNAE